MSQAAVRSALGRHPFDPALDISLAFATVTRAQYVSALNPYLELMI